MSRLLTAYAAIDAANGEDPNTIIVGGRDWPAEQVYGERMSATLARVYPDASELLKIAVRAQHLRRWTVPRTSYPIDRVGYLRWRTDLKAKHAEWAGAVLAECGYAPDEIARVASLIRKERLKQDAEAQALEDVASVVFLEFYAEAFAAKHDSEKVASILKKTLLKMSDRGRSAAQELSLPPPIAGLVSSALPDGS